MKVFNPTETMEAFKASRGLFADLRWLERICFNALEALDNLEAEPKRKKNYYKREAWWEDFEIVAHTPVDEGLTKATPARLKIVFGTDVVLRINWSSSSMTIEHFVDGDWVKKALNRFNEV